MKPDTVKRWIDRRCTSSAAGYAFIYQLVKEQWPFAAAPNQKISAESAASRLCLVRKSAGLGTSSPGIPLLKRSAEFFDTKG